MKRHNSIPPVERISVIVIQSDKPSKAKKEIKVIKDDFKEHGQIHAIIVSRSLEGVITLEAGSKRLEAARDLNWKEIRAIVIQIEDEYEPDQMREWVKLIEGHQRSELDDFALAKGAILMDEKYKIKGSIFARQLGLSNGYVYNLMRWYRTAPDKVREAWRQRSAHVNQAELEVYSHMTKAEATKAWDLRLRMHSSDMEPFQPGRKNGKTNGQPKPRRASERHIAKLQDAIDKSSLIIPVKSLATSILRFVLGVETNVPGITNYDKLPLVIIEKDEGKAKSRQAATS